MKPLDKIIKDTSYHCFENSKTKERRLNDYSQIQETCDLLLKILKPKPMFRVKLALVNRNKSGFIHLIEYFEFGVR